MDNNPEKVNERRSLKRFQVKQGAIALARPVDSTPLCLTDKSMGEIACEIYRSNPTKIGRINDISMGGLSFNYIDCMNESKQPVVFDIVLAHCGLYLENLTCKIVDSHDLEEDSLTPLTMKLLRVQFEGLLSDQISELHDLLENHCTLEM
jgi:hypothetical protein